MTCKKVFRCPVCLTVSDFNYSYILSSPLSSTHSSTIIPVKSAHICLRDWHHEPERLLVKLRWGICTVL